MMRTRVLRRLRRADRGGAAVETALAFPLLLLVVLGLMEFGMLMYAYNTVKHSALVGLRAASVERTVDQAAVVTLVRNSAFGLQMTDSAVVVRVNGGSKEFDTRTTGDSLEVSVSYYYTPVLSRVIPDLNVPIGTKARGVVW